MFDKVVKQCGLVTPSSGQYLARRVHSVLFSTSDDGTISFHEKIFKNYNADIQYNDEHFFINQHYKITFKYGKREIEYIYPDKIQPYVSHLGNYIFILEDLNQELRNDTVKDKILKIEDYKKKNPNIFKDKLSKLKYEAAKKAFENGNCPTQEELSNCSTSDEAKQLLNIYFENSFVDEYKKYSLELKDNFATLGINDL